VIKDVGARSSTVALARSLADARVDLDDAVGSHSNANDETVMATTSLADLLLAS